MKKINPFMNIALPKGREGHLAHAKIYSDNKTDSTDTAGHMNRIELVETTVSDLYGVLKRTARKAMSTLRESHTYQNRTLREAVPINQWTHIGGDRPIEELGDVVEMLGGEPLAVKLNGKKDVVYGFVTGLADGKVYVTKEKPSPDNVVLATPMHSPVTVSVPQKTYAHPVSAFAGYVPLRA